MDTENRDLDRYVAGNVDGLRKYLLTKVYLEPDAPGAKLLVNKEIVERWSLLLHRIISEMFLSERHKEIFCLYAELIYLWASTESISAEAEIRDSLVAPMLRYAAKRLEDRARVAITGKCYNYLTGKFEYVLEDGSHVPVDLTRRPCMPFHIEDMPACIKMLLDPAFYRSDRINKTLDE